jgi:hypothetical protein
MCTHIRISSTVRIVEFHHPSANFHDAHSKYLAAVDGRLSFFRRIFPRSAQVYSHYHGPVAIEKLAAHEQML